MSTTTWRCAWCGKIDVVEGVLAPMVYDSPIPPGWSWHPYTSPRVKGDTRALGCCPGHAACAADSFEKRPSPEGST